MVMTGSIPLRTYGRAQVKRMAQRGQTPDLECHMLNPGALLCPVFHTEFGRINVGLVSD